ncbi:MAG: hypothetical protein ABIW81_02075 [Terrimesophilobacter sp.]
MVEWFAYLQIAVAVAAGLFCLAVGFAGSIPNDLSLGATLIVEVLLVAQLVVSLLAPAFGNLPSGNPLEFYTYLISAILLLPLAGFWGLVERSKWSTVVLGVACLAAAIMLYRMLQIWTVQLA